VSSSDLALDVQNEVVKKFPPTEVGYVCARLSYECSDNLPFLESKTPEVARTILRIQLSVVRLSDGDVNLLSKYILMAKNDWRDVLLLGESAWGSLT
jgi:hypothetical protein